MPGDQNRADNHRHHGQRQQQVHHCQPYAGGGVPALEQPPVSTGIERMMQQKQYTQRYARPFMHPVVYHVIAHLAQLQDRHGNIHAGFDSLLHMRATPVKGFGPVAVPAEDSCWPASWRAFHSPSPTPFPDPDGSDSGPAYGNVL